MADTADWGPSGTIHADQGRVAARPRLGMLDLVLHLWRAKWLMLFVFLPIFALGLLAAFTMPEKYEARSRIFVKLGEEYVYKPRVGSEGAGATPEAEQLVQGEIELMLSPVVAERALSQFSLAQVFPALDAAKNEELALTSDPLERDAIEFEAFQEGVQAVQKSFNVDAAPKTPVISTSFKHSDPVISAEMLNAIIAEYITYRSEIFAATGTATLRNQREKFQAELLKAEDAIRSFLRENGFGSFDSERSTAQELFGTISGQLLEARSRASSVNAQLNTFRNQIGGIAAEQDMFVEDKSEDTLLQLRLEREDLLARYTENSQAVQAIDRRIDQVETFLGQKRSPVGLTRSGPNPLYQSVEAEISTLSAEADALSRQISELERQKAEYEARLRKFAEVEPEWQELLRRRDLMEANVRNFATREVEENALAEISGENADSVRVLEPARVPLRGSSLKMPVAALAFLFAGFTALMAGLLYALTRQGFATARSLERTTGLPVIGMIGSGAKRR